MAFANPFLSFIQRSEISQMRLKLLVTALTVIAATTAHAGTYEINYNAVDPVLNPSVYGDVFVTTLGNLANGSFAVTAISGTRGSDTITAQSSYAFADQKLYTAEPIFDLAGMSFSTAASGDFNLYSYDGSYYELASTVDAVGYAWNGTPITLTISAVPEPTSIALLGVGILGLSVMLGSRRSSGAARA